MVERLERRLCLSSAIVGVATGTVRYQYPLADGAVAQVPLAGRWVYRCGSAGDGLLTHLVGADAARLRVNPGLGGGILENFIALELIKQRGWSKLQPGSRSTAHILRISNAVARASAAAGILN